MLGSLYENDPEDARRACWRSSQLTDPEDEGENEPLADPPRWFAIPLFCETAGGPELADVQWYCARRENGETPINIQITRQEAFDLATDTDIAFSTFDTTAKTILGPSYSDDTEPQRKCLWRSWRRMDPEDPS